MSMNQANPGFNDAIQKYFGALSLPAGAAGRLLEWLERARVALLGGRTLCNERIVEYPMVFRLIQPAGRVLDVGCVSSRLPLQLASLGYEVHGVDLRPYPLRHPGFTFHQVDLLAPHTSFQPGSFDVITAVSCIEHFGLGAYGEGAQAEGDFRIVQVLRSLLVPQGQFLLTVPFGQAGVTPKHRIYDAERLGRLLAGFTIASAHYFMRSDEAWRPVEAARLADVASPGMPVNGVAIVDCRRSTA